MQKYCAEDEASGTKGTGTVAVQFWKWMFESGASIEEAIITSRAVPLIHSAGNSDQVKAVLFMTDTIQCAHPPDPVVVDRTMTYVIASLAGGFGLLVILFIGWFAARRHAMIVHPLMGVNVLQVCLCA